MKIAHLSDLHFTTFFRNSDFESIDSLLKYCRIKGTDHLVISGDLVDNPAPEDFEHLRMLLKSNGFLSSDKLSLVIGNHDIFGGVQTAEDIFNFPDRCAKVDFKKRVDEFYSFFPEAFEGCGYISPSNIFPYAKVVDGVLITGLNSVSEYSRSKNIFASNGSVSMEQFNELTGIFHMYENADTKLVIVHHHFNKIKIKPDNTFGSFWQNIEKQTMKLRKKKRLFELFGRYNVDLVLHGHFHESAGYYRKGIRFSNAGGTLKNDGKNIHQINFIDIKAGSIETEIQRLSKTVYPEYLPKAALVTV